MLISYRWITELLGADPGVARVAEKLTAAGLEVEGIDHVGAHLAAVKVARVVSSRPHPSSKNPLTLVTVETGEGAPLEVVCGAPNVPAPGGLVCFAPVGARVFDKKGVPFELEAKPVAGVVSAGMLCAEDELGLGADHAGIVVLDAGAPGQRVADVIPGAEDWILHLNVTPNRPDALGHAGVAREVAALLGITLRAPAAAQPARSRAAGQDETFHVRIEDRERCPRYDAALVADVQVKPSPLWLRARLTRLGVRPINVVVDVTNAVMLEYGQPLHGFDLANLADRTIVVRRARKGEELQTLDGQTRALDPEDLVIADAKRAVALAGVMGGEGSGIQSTTRAVLLESAYFEPRGVRRTAKRHGMHTEASHRFERDVDIAAVPDALARAVAMLTELAGGVAVGRAVDEFPHLREPRMITVRAARIREVLGADVPHDVVRAGLTALGFYGLIVTEGPSPEYTLMVPTHRPDVAREIDLVEEIARVWGYDKLPSALPSASGARAGATRDFRARRRVREACAALGLDEAVSYAFTAPAELAASGFGAAKVARITNPLSEERSVMRPSLLPRLFHSTSHAHRHGVARVRLFEVGTVFSPDAPQEAGLLRETSRVAAVLAGPRDAWLARPAPVDFYDAKGVVEGLVEAIARAPATFEPEASPPGWAHPRACAAVHLDGAVIGHVAEVHPDVIAAMDLPRATVALELDVRPLVRDRATPPARAPGRFPTVRRDVALLVPRAHPAGAIAAALRAHAGPVCESVELFDRYEGKELPPDTHSLAFALAYRSDERTLTDDEVDAWTKAAVARAGEAFGARQR